MVDIKKVLVVGRQQLEERLLGRGPVAMCWGKTYMFNQSCEKAGELEAHEERRHEYISCWVKEELALFHG